MVRLTLVDWCDTDVERTAVPSVCYPVDLSPGIFIPATICADDAADSDAAHSDDAIAGHVASDTDGGAPTIVTADDATDAAVKLVSLTTSAASPLVPVAATVAILAVAIIDAIDTPAAACFTLVGEAVVE